MNTIHPIARAGYRIQSNRSHIDTTIAYECYLIRSITLHLGRKPCTQTCKGDGFSGNPTSKRPPWLVTSNVQGTAGNHCPRNTNSCVSQQLTSRAKSVRLGTIGTHVTQPSGSMWFLMMISYLHSSNMARQCPSVLRMLYARCDARRTIQCRL
jgi:hypothetical protein